MNPLNAFWQLYANLLSWSMAAVRWPQRWQWSCCPLWRLIECLMLVLESGKVWLGARKRALAWFMYLYQRNAADGGLGMTTWAQGNDKTSFKLRSTAHAMRLSPPAAECTWNGEGLDYVLFVSALRHDCWTCRQWCFLGGWNDEQAGHNYVWDRLEQDV